MGAGARRHPYAHASRRRQPQLRGRKVVARTRARGADAEVPPRDPGRSNRIGAGGEELRPPERLGPAKNAGGGRSGVRPTRAGGAQCPHTPRPPPPSPAPPLKQGRPPMDRPTALLDAVRAAAEAAAVAIAVAKTIGNAGMHGRTGRPVSETPCGGGGGGHTLRRTRVRRPVRQSRGSNVVAPP